MQTLYGETPSNVSRKQEKTIGTINKLIERVDIEYIYLYTLIYTFSFKAKDAA